MLNQTKKITVAVLLSGLFLSLGIAFGANSTGFAEAAKEMAGNHYTELEATFSTSGTKEYWIDCATKEIYFEKPTSGSWHDNGVAPVIKNSSDPRYVAPICEDIVPTRTEIEDTTINRETDTVEDEDENNTGLIVKPLEGDGQAQEYTENDDDYKVVSYQGDNTTVVIPDGIKELDTWNNHPFDGSNKNSNAAVIETLVIPSSVEKLTVTAFKGLPNLTTVIISAKVIEYGAFNNCPSLKNVYLTSDVEEIQQSTFITSGAPLNQLKIFCEPTSRPQKWSDQFNIQAWTYPVSRYETFWGVAY